MWPEILSRSEQLKRDVRNFISVKLREAVSDDYVNDIYREIKDDVIGDVMETSDYAGGNWNDDDIKLAVGRVLLRRMGVSV